MSTPKRHHYVPQKYLSYFSDSANLIHVYDRASNEYRIQQPINTAVKSHYYRVYLKNGEPTDKVEKFIGEIESNAWPVIEKISKNQTISHLEKQKLALYVEIQKLRVPEYEMETNELKEKLIAKTNKLQYQSVDDAQAIINEYESEIPDGETITADELFEFVHSDRCKIKIPREHSILDMMNRCTDFAEYFMQMNWTFTTCGSSTQFITSDNPSTLTAPDNQSPFRGYGLLTPGAMKIVALTNSVSLYMGDQGEAMFYKQIGREWVRQFNYHQAVTSSQYLYSGNKQLLESIVKRTSLAELPYDRDRVSMS